MARAIIEESFRILLNSDGLVDWFGIGQQLKREGQNGARYGHHDVPHSRAHFDAF
jgi:hypothetical protein